MDEQTKKAYEAVLALKLFLIESGAQKWTYEETSFGDDMAPLVRVTVERV